MDDSPKKPPDSSINNQGDTARDLPVGVTNFAKIRQLGGYFADKTKYLYEIARWPKPYFLSRPRRFGKTLLLDTLECIFQGRRELFKGLWIDQSDYDWQPYPVIRLDMNGVVGDDVATMEIRLANQLAGLATIENIKLEKTIPADMLTNLVIELYLKSGQMVASLIDEFLADNEGSKLKKTIPTDELVSLLGFIKSESGQEVANLIDKFWADNEDLKLGKTIPNYRLRKFEDDLKMASRQKVAILIDEYDAPIVKRLADPPKAERFREALRDFYGTLKTSTQRIGHIFITGVSRFSKTSIFSEFNQLYDLTIDEEFAAICGLTEADLEDLLRDREERTLNALVKNNGLNPGSSGDDLRKLIRDWYDGYSWDGNTKVYNPWSILNFLAKGERSNYWFRSGAPNFLRQLGPKVMKDLLWLKNITNINNTNSTINNVNDLNPAALLFQAGYLTIKENLGYKGAELEYSLTVPNLEVQASLAPLIFSIEPPNDPVEAKKQAILVLESLLSLNAEGLEEAFSLYLNQYPYSTLNFDENLYQALFGAALFLVDQSYTAQEVTAHGILDIHFVSPNGAHYIIELKVYRAPTKKSSETNPFAETTDPPKKDSQPKRISPPHSDADKAKLRKSMTSKANAALKQIRAKYADKYRGSGKQVVMVALVMTRRTFVLAKFEVIEPK
jgi:hypothetical protein